MVEQGNPNNVPEKLFVVMGPTGAGKSAFINTIMGREVAKEGEKDDYNNSCTRDIKVYSHQAMDSEHLKKVFPGEQQKVVLNFIDTIGFDDVDQNFTNDEILDLVKSELLTTKLSTQIDGMVLIECPHNPKTSIITNLNKLFPIFGETIR